MKTLTDFFGKSLRTLEEQMTQITQDATHSATEALKAEGKSDEEFQAALPEAIQTAINTKLGELTKYEGDKLTWLKNALSLVKNKKGNLKRVLVMQAAEGESAPHGAQEIDGKHFSVEFFEEAGRPAETQAAPQGKFGDKKGGGKGRGGRDGKPGAGGGRGADSGRGGGRDGAQAGGGRGRDGAAAAPRPAPGTGKTSPLIKLGGASNSSAAPAKAPTITPKA
ncbi:MAG: hypothetical protein H7222_15315 [Methylotenera sp.]|nr:hypothetical protein [Oligoflexia bacterium]